MPSLDSCINNIYEPGFIPADPGVTPGVPQLGGIVASYPGAGLLRVGTTSRQRASARFAGAGSLSILANNPKKQGQARPAGQGSLSAQAVQPRQQAPATLPGNSSLSVNAIKI
jgi:hypothetical protein